MLVQYNILKIILTFIDDQVYKSMYLTNEFDEFVDLLYLRIKEFFVDIKEDIKDEVKKFILREFKTMEQFGKKKKKEEENNLITVVRKIKRDTIFSVKDFIFKQIHDEILTKEVNLKVLHLKELTSNRIFWFNIKGFNIIRSNKRFYNNEGRIITDIIVDLIMIEYNDYKEKKDLNKI